MLKIKKVCSISVNISTSYFKAARTFLAIRNICASLCAIGVSIFLWVYAKKLASSINDDNENSGSNIGNISIVNESELRFDKNASQTTPSPETELFYFETSKFVTTVGVIVFSAFIRLASSGTITIIQKDLTVVISNNDSDYLSSKYA